MRGDGNWRIEPVSRSRRRKPLAPDGRVCSADGCTTVLSRFNLDDRCAAHADSAGRPAIRRRRSGDRDRPTGTAG